MPVRALEARVARAGAGPLVTHYDLVADTRVELSARTFANWVDKTVNLIDELGLMADDAIALPVAVARPDHWVSLVWVMATWQFGAHLVSDESRADLVVDGPWCDAARAVPTVACSLHPLGLGCSSLPEGVTDYRDALAQPDVHWSNPTPASADCAPDRPERVLLADPHELGRSIDALTAALPQGSLVLVRGGTADDWRRLALVERAQFA